jgi:hypothetical protein
MLDDRKIRIRIRTSDYRVMDLDPDPGGPKTYGSYGSGYGFRSESATLVKGYRACINVLDKRGYSEKELSVLNSLICL